MYTCMYICIRIVYIKALLQVGYENVALGGMLRDINLVQDETNLSQDTLRCCNFSTRQCCD